MFKAACFGAGLLCLGAGCCASCYRPPVEDGKSGGGDNKQNLPPGDTRTGCCGSGMGCIATTLCCACFGGRPVEGADAATMASSACFGAGICGSGAGCCVWAVLLATVESGVGCLEAIVCCACGAQGSADPEATEVAGNHACFGAGLCGPGLGFCGGAKEGLAIGCCSSGLGCALTALFCACFGGRPGSKQATPMCEAACFGAGLCGTGPGCCAGIDEDQVDGPTGPGGCCRSGQGCLATTLCLACGGGEGKGARGVCSAACCGAWGDGCCSGGEQGAGFFESILCFACGAGRTAPSGHHDHDGGEFVGGDQKAVLAKAAKNRACCGAGLCFAGPGCCGGPTDDTIGCCASGFGCLGTILCCACGAGVADASGYRPSKLGKAACCGGVAAGCKCSTPGKADLAPSIARAASTSKDADEQLERMLPAPGRRWRNVRVWLGLHGHVFVLCVRWWSARRGGQARSVQLSVLRSWLLRRWLRRRPRGQG